MSRLSSRPDSRAGRMTLMVGLTLSMGLLAGCDDTGQLGFLTPNAQASTAGSTRSTKLVERDVEAPEVFNVTDQGLWDGRPSLGGVWVAHPDVTDPERVIIRNEANGKFVIGALFRRERELPGPNLQMSSDAAAALNVLAGAPAQLNVVALRREEAEETAEAEAAAQSVQAPSDVTETTLDPSASAGQAIDAAEVPPATAAPATPAAAPAPAPAPRPTSNLSKPFVQIGIFSVEANANRAAKQMRGAGLVPTIKKSEINGKPFWRVVVGPATSQSELNALVNKIKGEGFSDAYAVSS